MNRRLSDERSDPTRDAVDVRASGTGTSGYEERLVESVLLGPREIREPPQLLPPIAHLLGRQTYSSVQMPSLGIYRDDAVLFNDSVANRLRAHQASIDAQLLIERRRLENQFESQWQLGRLQAASLMQYNVPPWPPGEAVNLLPEAHFPMLGRSLGSYHEPMLADRQLQLQLLQNSRRAAMAPEATIPNPRQPSSFHHLDALPQKFPVKLYKMMMEAERNHDEDIISFSPDGCAILFLDRERLASELIPRYFRHNSLASFRRQLYLYGFVKCVCQGKKGYRHDLFRRDRPDLLTMIRRSYERDEA